MGIPMAMSTSGKSFDVYKNKNNVGFAALMLNLSKKKNSY